MPKKLKYPPLTQEQINFYRKNGYTATCTKYNIKSATFSYFLKRDKITVNKSNFGPNKSNLSLAAILELKKTHTYKEISKICGIGEAALFQRVHRNKVKLVSEIWLLTSFFEKAKIKADHLIINPQKITITNHEVALNKQQVSSLIKDFETIINILKNFYAR